MTATEFLKRFDQAFNAIDDGTNFVSLADLKERMHLNYADDDTFERFLKLMRKGGAIHLIRANGRAGGYTERELAAGIEEQGYLLLYVAKEN